ncbi:MAG: pyruvate dehydrogenase complex dihydrolipoamide acetyltransferase [Alphaproteobacteria bacterium]|nr:pyruvate dehydrogenase complex dihydrolipoamide acetyltransferase [Alphaproteobacteria bacterium]
MPIQILMPALSPTMTEGTLARWHKREGQAVKSGDVLAEIETDKATMELEAIDDGVLGRILVPDGAEGVAVNTPIAVLLSAGEGAEALAKFKVSAPPTVPPAVPATPAAVAAPMPKSNGAAAAPTAQPLVGRVFASPLARRIAADSGIDLRSVAGSGPSGRIVKADVETAHGADPAKTVQRARPLAPMAGEPGFELLPLTGMRKIVARRMTDAKQQVPHFYLTVDCEINELLKLRARLNERAAGRYKLSVNDMVLKALAIALKRVPAANAAWSDAGIKLYKSVDVAVAVAVEGGLYTPVIRDADGKGLETISTEMKSLAERARAGKLLPEEYQGGTVSLTNLGMFGVKEFAAVINQPQGCILAVGAGEKRPVVKNDALAIATVMTVTLSVDHRSVDGAVGAKLLAAFKALVEDPLTMLL